MPTASGPIALLTDFGHHDHYAGLLRAVIATIAPTAPVIDLTHGIGAQDVIGGALVLAESWRFFPPKTIFLAIVDPGVGSVRRPVAVETDSGARFVGPDNGLLWWAVERAGLKRAVELAAPRYRLPEVSNTFHGRDIFAPAAAHLWRGIKLARLGPVVLNLVRLPVESTSEQKQAVTGVVIYIDGYGNLITNVSSAQVESLLARFPGRRLMVKIPRNSAVEFCRTYADVPERVPLALIGSFQRLEIAVRNGSAAATCGAAVGTKVILNMRS